MPHNTNDFSLDVKTFFSSIEPMFDFLVAQDIFSPKDYATFVTSCSYSLIDVGKYCEQYSIKITSLDRIKVLVFSIPYLQDSLKNKLNIERYIESIFLILKNAYVYNKKFSLATIKQSISVCKKLLNNGELIAIYTYIKGFQESMNYAVPTDPFLYQYEKPLNKINNALISVTDKTGIAEFARALQLKNITIFSTGGTAKHLINNNIKVVNIETYTNFPEMMNGRIKTINPKIHGGILARRDTDKQLMEEHNIPPIDLVVVNLYPFQETINQPDCNLEDAIKNIDIGGPAMLRSAAKNHAWVTAVVDNKDYQTIINEINKSNNTTLKTRTKMALKVFEHTAKYDGDIANYLGQEQDGFSNTINLQFKKVKSMRYGENPHQKAAFYIENTPSESCVASSTQLQGKAMSFNNMTDTNAALECVRNFNEPCCVIVKHANPCGVAVCADIHQAYLTAFKTDPTSAFGGIIAFNQTLNEQTTNTILNKQFVEVIIAPDITTNAKKVLSNKPNIRVLSCGKLTPTQPSLDYKRITGGLLAQDTDLDIMVNKNSIKYVSKLVPTDTQIKDLLFAWKVAQAVKSNAIVYAKNQMTIGIGAGQMSRIYSAKIASIKAAAENLTIEGSVMASDAFFPFRDTIDTAAKSGIKAIIQPGGSMRDDEVIKAANEHNISMVFTNIRHFKH